MADEELRLRHRGYPPAVGPTVTTTLQAPEPDLTDVAPPCLAGLAAEPVRVGDGSDDPRPIAWLIPALADGRAVWGELVAAFPTTGWWPVILDNLEGDAGGPWHTGKFAGPDAGIGEPREILERTRLAFGLPDEDEEEFEEFDADGPWTQPITQLAGATTFPGPVAIPVPPEVPALLVVPTARPADVPARLGWAGASDRELTGGDVTAILRLWEKKFNAVLLVLDITEIGVFVPSPPTARHAELMACEFAALSPEDGGENWETFGELMEMAHRRAWWVRF